ncbi:serine/threonine-protein phosphatase 6 regulatory ankyrin repeat subunit B isoform X7 [Triticum aestivum]|uniref:serine/threonine-protein phosphatase 6 regulatory ankyrin repeat subunit B isoform X7 n=1 Tax=Triticum aestivum TaxID=4565 RepID=UPI001D035B29|nr:serine/threonine-protein phosphatase 6 regulatory ankyrin repeat subunit B-like isoform X7 [Triticum aestivum]
MCQFHLINTLSSIMKILLHIVSNSMGLLCVSWGAISKFHALREDRAVLGNFCGRTPLLFATYHNGGTAEYLLDHGANQDKADHDGSTLLHYAAELGNCEMVELLLAKGAYVEPVSACGTPLHVAAGKGHYGAMKILLDHNADYNKMVNGVTPLIVATDAKSMKCIKLLVKAGANLKEAAAYTTLHAEKVVSDYFLNCIMEDVDANRDVPFDQGPMLKREIVTSGLISRGSNSLKNKDYVVAAKLYSKAMVLDPDDAVLFSDRSLCWLQLGDGKKALLDANRCRKMRPHWPKACHRQGEALMLLKDYEGASERFWDGLKLDPVDTDIEDALRISECHFVLSSMPMPSCHIPT